MSATFARFHPNFILGGTYSGQIVLWDNRVPKRTPVQRSPLSAAAHTHPVYCMRVVGTQNAHNLISISTDGKESVEEFRFVRLFAISTQRTVKLSLEFSIIRLTPTNTCRCALGA